MSFSTLAFLTIALVLALLSCAINTASVPQQIHRNTLTVKKKDTISIIAVGDLMIGFAYPDKSNLPADDAVNGFNSVDSLLKRDIVFGNLKAVKALTHLDFPTHNLKFSGAGRIELKD